MAQHYTFSGIFHPDIFIVSGVYDNLYKALQGSGW